ncbi:MAG TPA: DUF4350 domain-containing protein [Clostridiaceae bacterium]
MKTRNKKDIFIFIILVLLFLIFTFYISKTMQGNNPSIDNNSSNGISAFYKTLKALKLPVERSLLPIEETNIQDIQLVTDYGSFNLHNPDILDWVNKGGTLIYFTNDKQTLVDFSSSPEIKGNLKIYALKKGLIIQAETVSIANKTLLSNTDKAYEIFSEIDSHPYKHIVFSEGYIYSQAKVKSLWDFIPFQGKIIIYQLVLIILAFFYYRGKRFGKALPLYDEVERDENEYLYSSSSLYNIANCWDIMFESYYKSLLKEIRYSSGNWIEYWERENLPSILKAKRVYAFMEKGNKNIRKKEYIEIINCIEQLKNILMKRRATNWKPLKKTH